jgi:hypothetical protein
MRQKKQYLAVLIELGLTPSSASRCHPLPVEKKRARSGLASYFNDPSWGPQPDGFHFHLC